MLTIPEKSRQGFSLIFEDENLEPFLPTTVRYRVYDRDTETELLAWTDASPDTTVEIILAASINRILDDNNAYETRVLTVQSDQDTDSQLSQEREYRVQNLRGFQ